ncbi:hypothetical protein [Azospirillum canadense]|nr:hypothetical protein [Azospirillum canadense]MCW2240787.1 hypothetical protein [Azospirillum canadense]
MINVDNFFIRPSKKSITICVRQNRIDQRQGTAVVDTPSVT